MPASVLPRGGMATRIIPAAVRARLERFPREFDEGEVEEHVTLSAADLEWVPITTSAANRLGLALQLCALRWLGFCPAELTSARAFVVGRLATQLDVPGDALGD